ncbi:MAG TPA: radical SAM protein [Terriglobales bacterium]|nr:radical SAM protein [Terriglobales bacterium]
MDAANYADFSKSIHQHYFGKRAPLDVAIEVTRRCPLECLHCYNNLEMGDLAARNRELTTQEHFKLLDELAQMGCLWILYTGGEIFARKDFLEIYTYAKKKGFIITLFTNGTLISPKIADHLAEWPPFGIEITLYGMTKQTYEELTSIPGSFDRCMRGIDLLRERGLPLKLKTVPTKINRHEVFAMKEFAEGLGFGFKYDAMLNPRIDCSQSPLAVRLSPQDVVALDLAEPERRRDYERFAAEDLRRSAPARTGQTVYFCGGGMNSFAVDPYGHMSICVLSHQETYDIRQGSVREGWETFLSKVRSKRPTRLTKCNDCRMQSSCGMCPANGELEAGDPESPVDFLCHVTHLRTMALGFEVPPHGECDFCAGGAHHAELCESAKAIAASEIDVGEWRREKSLLPILNTSQASAGCASCRSHA